jgi:methionyl aminopeptidase
MIIIKSKQEIEKIYKSCQIAKEVLNEVKKKITPGITTLELDEFANSLIEEKGAKSAFYKYRGFPSHICTSINEEVVHGIPSKRVLKEGDIISIDIGVVYDGYFGDVAATFSVNGIDERKKKLIKVTEEALNIGIKNAIIGKRIGNISYAIQKFVEENGFSVVRDYTGHGIGLHLHEDPKIPNFGNPEEGEIIRNGMVLCIEPMVNMGTYKIKIKNDKWTAVTMDGLPSAHFEHTIAIVDNNVQILTL